MYTSACLCGCLYLHCSQLYYCSAVEYVKIYSFSAYLKLPWHPEKKSECYNAKQVGSEGVRANKRGSKHLVPNIDTVQKEFLNTHIFNQYI